ncbi:TetR family transcriptional regulator [Acidimicrobiia bacterium EGI L10123]|uniref:TetR family transcriptional regulator n=1 Tax=Salinilacustrithrix flava TaxID=2957203 RepID=UPI003D7C1FEF|nr:TetR family transcriptional regulator [Acidimicrobiia bacterium EGI L10123]
MPALPVVSELTPKQQARRQGIIDVAIEMATEGGYEAVQMRDVAARADVALGTLYRYFSSKDQLLGACWAEWTQQLENRISRRPLKGETPSDRIVDFFARANRAVERSGKLTSALIMSMASADPATIEPQSEVASLMTRVVLEELEGLEPEIQRRIREALGHVWYSVLVNWVNGRLPMRRVNRALESATRLIIDPHV